MRAHSALSAVAAAVLLVAGSTAAAAEPPSPAPPPAVRYVERQQQRAELLEEQWARWVAEIDRQQREAWFAELERQAIERAEAERLAAEHAAAERAAAGEVWRTRSTVYCLGGIMANGERVRPGSVAVNSARWRELRGSSWRVETGHFAGQTFTVRDHGPGAHFDVWQGNRRDCRHFALGVYGAPTITVRRVG